MTSGGWRKTRVCQAYWAMRCPPDAARKCRDADCGLYAFHEDEAIATAKAQRPAGQMSFIPIETDPLQGLARVNVDLVRAVSARCPNQRTATIDEDATIHESHKREALPHYEVGRRLRGDGAISR